MDRKMLHDFQQPSSRGDPRTHHDEIHEASTHKDAYVLDMMGYQAQGASVSGIASYIATTF